MAVVNTSRFSPRTGVQVIPDGFNEYHAPTASGTHVAEVEYWTGPAAGEPATVWDPVEHTETPNRGLRVPDRSITARIQRVLSEEQTVAGSQLVSTHAYMVTTNQAVPSSLSVDGFVRVVDGDPYLDGRWLAVEGVQGNALRFERAIMCLDNQG